MRNLMPFQTLKIIYILSERGKVIFRENIMSFRKAVFCHRNKLEYNKTLNSVKIKNIKTFSQTK